MGGGGGGGAAAVVGPPHAPVRRFVAIFNSQGKTANITNIKLCDVTVTSCFYVQELKLSIIEFYY